MAKEKIVQGKAILQLFKELQADKKPLTLLLPNGDEMRFAEITSISRRKLAHHLVINTPEVYDRLSQEADQPCLRFEFTDTEDIKYVFEADTWELHRDMVWVKIPEMVHRYQRRKLFRLEAPPGTRLYFKVNDIRYKLLVVNLSLGGTLGVLVSLTQKMDELIRPFGSNILENAELLFPSEDRKVTGTIVNIEQFQILRQKKNPATGKFECAIEFNQVRPAQHTKLKNLFYKWQRDYLRKRKFMQS